MQRLFGIGLAAELPCDAPLRLADGHPLLHPGFQLSVIVDGGRVAHADPRIGLMHRSAEKLFESRDYRQAMLLANRHDWLSPFTSEVCVARAIESALGIAVPERAATIRTLMLEAERIAATLAFLSTASDDAARLRSAYLDALEAATGARVHPGFARIGGVAHDLDAASLTALRAWIADVQASLAALAEDVSDYAAPLAGVAVLSREQAVSYGVTGVVGRASGLDLDLRRDDPAYAGLPWATTLRTEGDAPARYAVLVGQLTVSVDIAQACLRRLETLAGPIDVPLPKVLRLPEGLAHACLDGPLGTCGVLIASSGEKTPLRMKIRSASLATMQAMAVALAGTRVDPDDDYRDLAAAVMSFPMVIGDTDR